MDGANKYLYRRFLPPLACRFASLIAVSVADGLPLGVVVCSFASGPQNGRPFSPAGSPDSTAAASALGSGNNRNGWREKALTLWQTGQVVGQRAPSAHEELLDHRQERAHHPVQHSAGVERECHIAKDNRHDQHGLAHHLLLRVLNLRHRHQRGQQLQDDRKHWQDVVRIACCKARQPQKTSGECGVRRQQLHGLIHADEDRQLDEDRQTTTGRIGLVLFVELAHFLGKFLLILAMLTAQLLDQAAATLAFSSMIAVA